MRTARISRGGQVQIPAEVRRRWGTEDILIDDAGTYLRIRPIPDDPIAAAAGSLAGPGPNVNEIMRMGREEEIDAEEHRRSQPERKR